jgi:hypothetical protein
VEQATACEVRQMKRFSLTEVEAFADRWSAAGEQTVQHWEVWETEAERFFGRGETDDGEGYHEVMLIVQPMCHGSIGDVKAAMRRATPNTLSMARTMLGHIPQFVTVLDAEQHFRDGMLAADWSMQADGAGAVVVRSEFRRPGTDH